MMRRWLPVLMAAIAVLAAAAVSGTAHPAASAERQASVSKTLSSRVLTPDGRDTYSVSLSSGRISMSAPRTNTGNNLREVFWPTGQGPMQNSEVCATWTDQSSSYVQQGVALRIVDGSTSTRALTVTKNVWAGAFWVFNVHTWDSSLAQPFTAVSQHDMSKVVWQNNQARPLPWRICARVKDTSLTFKVWLPDREPEPTYTRTADQDHVATTTVPSGYLGPGRTGWYVGHIPPGGGAHYNGLAITQLP